MDLPPITFLTRAGCPGSPPLLANLGAALAALDSTAAPSVVDLGDLAADDPRTGYGTPTILVGGADLFGMPAPEPAAPM